MQDEIPEQEFSPGERVLIVEDDSSTRTGLAELVQARFTEDSARLRGILVRAQARGRVRADADLDVMMTLLGIYFAAQPLAAVADPDYSLARYHAALGAALAPFLAGPA